MNAKIKLLIIMTSILMIFPSWIFLKKTKEVNNNFPVYHGSDLGLTYTPSQTTFRVWSPVASSVRLRLYNEGVGGTAIQNELMTKDSMGTWFFNLKGDWKNKFYTYQVTIGNKTNNEVTDIYAKAVGVNGGRGMIVNLQETNPDGWENDKRPPLKSYSDIIIWEVHTRDISVHPSSGIQNKGKFLGFTEKGTKSPQGEKTGIDHIIDLGVTHVHLLPVFDFKSIDEAKPNDKYNWGYDPQNYNTPEGSYSTNPYDGNVRIKEFKQMVKAFHDNGIRVIMDVVYNHTSETEKSNFEQLVPGYYYRMTVDGKFSNASACGNETASEKPMMRKFMIESIKYWATEYHVDGFRFDLMAIHDQETMNQIRAELDKVDKTIFMYGEGWSAGDSPLPCEQRAAKELVEKLDRIAVFSDEIRDGIRGHWSKSTEAGFMCGKNDLEESIKFGVVGAIDHPQIRYKNVNYAKRPYSNSPTQTIVYVTCHDNPCLWDKINFTCTKASEKEKLSVQKLANAIVLTSQGVAFLQAGEEIVRTKHGIENSFNSPDSINWLDWTRKSKYKEVYNYYKSLVALRKRHPAFHMPNKEMIGKNLEFLEMPKPLMVGYQISNNANGDNWKSILVYFNANPEKVLKSLPPGDWRIVGNGDEINENGLTTAGFETIQKGSTQIQGRSMLMLVDIASLK
jgi:pullulanase